MFFATKYEKLKKFTQTNIQNNNNEFTPQNENEKEDESKQVLIELQPYQMSKQNSKKESKNNTDHLSLLPSNEEINFSIIESNNDSKKFKKTVKILCSFLCLILLLISIIVLITIFISFTIIVDDEELNCSYQKHQNLTEIYYISDDIYADIDPSNLLFSNQSNQLQQLNFSEEEEKEIIKFFTISDLHIDITYDVNNTCGKKGALSDSSTKDFSLGQYKCDPPFELISSLFVFFS